MVPAQAEVGTITLKRTISSFLFELAQRIDSGTVLDLSCDVAMDAGFGYCDDCTGEQFINEGYE